MAATTNTASKFDAMGKEELRAACREAGVSYSKLNNDGMRAALTAHYAALEVAEAPALEVAAEGEVVHQPARPNVFAQMLDLTPAPLPVGCGTGTRVVGKKVDPNASKAKGESRARVEKNPAPAVPCTKRPLPPAAKTQLPKQRRPKQRPCMPAAAATKSGARRSTRASSTG